MLTDITHCIFALCNLLRPYGLAYEITGCPKFGVSVKENVLGSLLRVCGRTLRGLLTSILFNIVLAELKAYLSDWTEELG